ncbi:hypothetical protein GUJ93_ZPchr0013g37171 [Zizania palustris]|uniref:Uncharacterized protein n=1 Tax=Zizania palustris TaxID=103762 RepID=A0A8J6C044_ZIZPA|nr:hypothetical protein GUJ93_ZPchr0013g37171 [Zizania palustris]
MSLLASPTPFGAASSAAVRRRAPAGANQLLPLSRRAELHVALARKGGVSSRTQRRLEDRGRKRRGGGSVTAPAPPDMEEDAGVGVDWEGEPLGFEVSTTPMPELPDLEKPDFWEGSQWDSLGFFVQYMWAFGVFFGLVACGFAVATYNEGATDFRETPSYKESQTQEFPEESESSGSDVFEGNPTEVAPALE